MTTPPPPALDPERFRRLAHETVDLVADYLAGVRERPVFRPMTPAERAALMQEPSARPASTPKPCCIASARPSCRTPWATVTRASSAG